jgi:predicted alpha/beta superfamily hydrolase
MLKSALPSIVLAFALFALSGCSGSDGGGEPAGPTEPPAIEIGHRHVLTSEILGERRPVWVGLPSGYDSSDEPYPVVYVLDGEANFHHTTGSARLLASSYRMPGAIVVGINNVRRARARDMTPTPALAGELEGYPGRAAMGGAEDFLRFLTEELRPWVDERYRTRPYDILIGHSLGGLFVTEVLNRAPWSFDAYISISPSLWWNDEGWLRSIGDLFERHPDASGSLYMTGGNEGGEMLAGALAFVDTLEKHAPPGLRWKWTHMPDENHLSVRYRSTHGGLDWIFDGWDPDLLLRPVANGERAAGPAMADLEAQYDEVSARVGWTVKPPENLLSGLAEQVSGEGRQDEAVELLRRAVAWYPDGPRTHRNLAEALTRVCRWDEARLHYGHARARAEDAGYESDVAMYDERLEEVDRLEATGGACG